MDNTKDGKKRKNRMGGLHLPMSQRCNGICGRGFLLYAPPGHFSSSYMEKKKLFAQVSAIYSAAFTQLLCPRVTGLSCLTLRRAWMSFMSCSLPVRPLWMSLMPQVTSHGTGCLCEDNSINTRMLRQQGWPSAG